MAIGVDNINDVEYEVIWEDRPAGLWQRFLTLIHLNFTKYQITKDELIIQKGFFNRRTNSIELYLLKDPDVKESIYQRLLKIGTLSVKVDTRSGVEGQTRIFVLRNVRNCEAVRKLLRDNIERDVMERKITYFDHI
ncbi:MAG: PH domain-containing protein [Bacilli bacterium]|nr:PH domain-containing protein [Bacilli bacterium]